VAVAKTAAAPSPQRMEIIPCARPYTRGKRKRERRRAPSGAVAPSSGWIVHLTQPPPARLDRLVPFDTRRTDG
jgi:hypothetical protein